MLEARTEILEDFGLQMRELRAEVYEDIMEKAEAAELLDSAEKLSVIAQLKQISGQPAPSKMLHSCEEPER